jgi:limonene-1,2-epoxide hydrolase
VRKIIIIAGPLVSLALAGCAGSSSSSTPLGTTSAFLNALANGDGQKACALLSAHEQDVLANSGGSFESGSCAATVAFVS